MDHEIEYMQQNYTLLAPVSKWHLSSHKEVIQLMRNRYNVNNILQHQIIE